MPSTAGVCVYLQVSDGSASMTTPRISDESWQLLWGHFFTQDERAAPLPPHGLPISGRIEFDIDLRRAKWFNSWMGHPTREKGESEAMSGEPSMVPTHWRDDSRTSLFPTDQVVEDGFSPSDPNPPATALLSRTATQRHWPRPLLLERRDPNSARSFSKHPSRTPSISHEYLSPEAHDAAATVPRADTSFVPKTLSPVAQEQEEPQTARKADLEAIVRQWRQSSSVAGRPANTALSAAGQPSLDPVNMPSGADVELDLNDFGWSISSVGPSLDSPLSPEWPEPLPSVHLSERLRGSVCLTPSVCTSFGPLDYDWPDSPVSCVSRRPSPDLGMRTLDSVPLTPSTATSWGPDEPPSPMVTEYDLEYRAPSIDLGVRGMGSRPVTPSTATSWGPADSPSFMPSTPYYTRTPDVGERAFSDSAACAQSMHVPFFPNHSVWNTRPWGHVWPYQPLHRCGSERITLSAPVRRLQSKPLLPEWLDFTSLYSSPNPSNSASTKSLPVELPRLVGYPFFNIYPAVYPYTLDELYPAPSETRPSHSITSAAPVAVNAWSTGSLPEWPDFAALYPSDPTVEQAAANKSLPVGLPRPAGYPLFDLYPIVYPYTLDGLYPVPSETRPSHSITPASPVAANVWSADSLPEWPDFAALHPSTTEQAAASKSLPVGLPRPAGYPLFDLYPVVYPYTLDELYPAPSETRPSHDITSASPVAANVWSTDSLPEWPDFAALYSSPSPSNSASTKSLPVELPRPAGYPLFDLYPTAYPYTLDEIYLTPSETRLPHGITSASPVAANVWSTGSLPEWPDFAALYPSDPTAEQAAANKSLPVGLPRPAGYPLFDIYPVVYPYTLDELYPAPSETRPSHGITSASPFTTNVRSTGSLPEWPDFAALYPSDPTAEQAATNKSLPVGLPRPQGYPFIDLYPVVYPYTLDRLYPALSSAQPSCSVALTPSVDASARDNGSLPEWTDFSTLCLPEYTLGPAEKSRPVTLPRERGYPCIILYDLAYPYHLEEIYPFEHPTPFLQSSASCSCSLMVSVNLQESLDALGLYPFDAKAQVTVSKSQSTGLPTPGYPFLLVYPSVYPFNLADIYGPGVSVMHDIGASTERICPQLLAYSGYPTFNLCRSRLPLV